MKRGRCPDPLPAALFWLQQKVDCKREGAAATRVLVFNLLRFICAGLVDMLVRHGPSSRAGAAAKVARCYTGPQNGEIARSCVECDGDAPLVRKEDAPPQLLVSPVTTL